MRTKKGGAAIVMGALSPRTRNSQVELYQSGQVDYLIATDAIGMGLNMDIDHVAFASDIKFDGNAPRHLSAAEIAQIAGRAGRHSRNGSFGVVEDYLNFEEDTIEQIETHSFMSLRNIWWRNTELNFNSLNNLVRSLEAPPPFNFMRKKVGALDAICLNHLSEQDSIKNKIDSRETLSLLWNICQIPDFSNSLSSMHFNLLEKTFELLLIGKLDNDWMNSQISRHDRVDGEIDTLLNRISNIRTWTFITNRKNWLDEADYWQAQAKAIEDKLSDELHDRLTQRFVDKKIVILNKTMKEHHNLEAVIRLDGKVFVEEEEVGTLNGFDFIPYLSEGEKAATILTAARKILPKEIERRVRELLISDNAAFKFNSDGTIRWQHNKVAVLVQGDNLYSPKISVNNSELLLDEHIKQIELRINEAVEKNIKDKLDLAQKEYEKLQEEFISLYPKEAQGLGLVTKEMTKREKKLKALGDLAKGESKESARISQLNAIINTAEAVTEFLTKGSFGKAALAGIMGAKQVDTIEKSLTGYATGADYVTSGPEMIMVGDNPSGRERVQVTPLDAGGEPTGGGGAVHITFNSPVMSADHTEDVIIPQIREAIRRGADIGVS